MTLKLLDPAKLVNTRSQALAFVDTPNGRVLSSGPVRPVSTPARAGRTEKPVVSFRLAASDAAEYLIRVNGHGPAYRVARTPAPGRLARREINLPADRPVLLLLEEPREFEPQGLHALAELVDGLGRPPILHPGSALAMVDPEPDGSATK